MITPSHTSSPPTPAIVSTVSDTTLSPVTERGVNGYDDPYHRTLKRSKLRIPQNRRWDRHQPGHWRSERDLAR